MRLSTKGRYAVMAMVDLARSAGAAETRGAVCLADIAERQQISQPYLEQLFARLRRAGLVDSVRGPGGGYRLARDAANTTIAEIVVAADEPIRAVRCDGAAGCLAGGERCLTHGLWDALDGQIHQFLSRVSLEDVVERRLDALGTGG